MDSYHRVLDALNHIEPDRIPIDLGGTPMTGIHKNAYRQLKNHLGMDSEELIVEDTMQQLARVDEEIHTYFKTDVRNAVPRASDSCEMELQYKNGYAVYDDIWGIGWKMPLEGGFYFDMFRHPLQDVENKNDLNAYLWPDPLAGNPFVNIRQNVLKVIESGFMPVVGGFCPGVTTMHAWLRGFENFFTDFLINPCVAEAIMDRVQEIKMNYWEGVLTQIKDIPCVVIESDDLGRQTNMLYSPNIYRKFVKPKHSQLFSFIKSLAPVKIFFHSCGSIRKVLGDLIDAGIDIINPVQKSAAGMDLVELKKQFGKDVVFWGGGVDTQHILPNGNAKNVIDDVRSSIETLAPGGGFVFATVHNIQAKVPPENILAMWQTVRELGTY